MDASDIKVGTLWRSKHAPGFIVDVYAVKPALTAAAGGGVLCVHEATGFCQHIPVEDWLRSWEPCDAPE